MKKKLLVVFVLVMSVLGVTACADRTSGTDEKTQSETVGDVSEQSEFEPDYDKTDDGLVFQDIDGGVTLFRYEGEEETVVVPETYQGKNVVELGMSCFSQHMSGDSVLKKVTLPDSLTVIEENAFGRCHNLTSVNIPDHVTVIGYQAFADCTNLESITIPGSVTAIGDNAFIYCEKLKSVDIEDGVAAIGEKAFQHCKSMEQITLPDSVTTVGGWAFDGCENLTSVIIGDGVAEIADYAFGDCINLTNVVLPDNVTVLGRAFPGCDNIAVTYKGVTYTDDNMDDLYEQFDGE